MKAGRPLEVIVNPLARRGTAYREALAVFRAAGWVPRVHDCREEDPEEVVTAAVRAGAGRVVVAGGDGTLAQAARPLLYSGTALGILPLGTGNTFARNMGVPRDVVQAARVIVSGSERRVDVGEVNGRVFLNSVTLGFSAQIAANLTPALKRRLGWLAYLPAAWPVARHPPSLRLTVTADGVPSRLHTPQLVIANARDVAADLLVPGADYQDGRLVLLALPAGSPLATLANLVRWKLGDTSRLRVQRVGEVGVMGVGEALHANVDGDLTWEVMLSVQTHRTALTVCVPPAPRS
ncbi:diacylglycerol/lipid kinase family protein [Deinococcus metallilatus]|uniref:Diacylglycerol kinase family enzyme n=1 Tax=Deinococcus metallilatus TaxID=1211322 RepID=A0ABR6MNN2_9DEIO|nr:diacylglycerol kinase family protein [Deinococcus metallilatus]MBB5293556.1 diacylglycerol kinase family enzyme [Deinococcus metallilatus]